MFLYSFVCSPFLLFPLFFCLREKGGYSTQTATVRASALLPAGFAECAARRGGGQCCVATGVEPASGAARGAVVARTDESTVVMLYIGTENNENYRGPAPLANVAAQIAAAAGPSGRNAEYLYGLHDAMAALSPLCSDGDGAVEHYLAELTRRVRLIDAAAEATTSFDC